MAVKNSRTASKKVQVNLGSGRDLLPGFINVDNFIAVESDEFRQGDLRALPFDKDSVDYILCNNVLEHLPMADVPMAVYEIRRILKPGGRAVIIVPDFAWLCRTWLAMEEIGFHAVTHRWIAEEFYGNQHHEGEYHRTPMSPGYLNYVLQMCGFLNYSMTKYSVNAELPTHIVGLVQKGEHSRFRNDMLIVEITK